ncbi:MAG: tRNA (N6-threonylcarbamoyladenosine(37)-N6)-methyltransferase TrmO [Lachnospiraceae bacterium]|nr:tRNA (N6-threonylcarbamoyladenosine(37)-N6)-methyltransferase TrmO [Lachnospiraceae bacterium]
MKTIAHIYTDFPEKFGIPRQSGLVEGAIGKIIFEPEYRVAEAVRGLEAYSHIWVLWKFSESERKEWSPTVRPPRLGGNKRMGVFATRSPFRPNPIGLSSVRLERVELDEKFGPVLWVSGVDMLDGTPIYDIKPYLAYCDSHAEALCGFADEVKEHALKVTFDEGVEAAMSREELQTICEILSQDPRTAYVNDAEREWGLAYGNYNIKFKVNDKELRIVEVRCRT